MAIAAKRFTMLSDETNIGVAGFGSKADSSILNLPINDLPAPTATLDQLVQSAIERNQAEEDGMSAFDKVTRFTKDGSSSIIDLSKLPAGAKAEFLNAMSGGNPAYAKTLDGMMGRCSAGNGFGTGMNGRMPNASMNCGGNGLSFGQGGNSGNGCSASSFGDLLGKLTNGLFSGLFKDSASALRALMALAGYGYNLGMCGVMGSMLGSPMAQGLTNSELSMASGSLLGTLGMGGNTNGYLDVAKSSAGLSPMRSNPSAIGGFFDNFKMPSGTTENMFSGLSDRVMGGVESLNGFWNSSTFDGVRSIGEMSRYQEDLDAVYLAKLSDRSAGATELDVIPSSDDDFDMAAYRTSDWGSGSSDNIWG